ncbi:ribonucleotide reductase [Mycobacterium phage Gaia]|uniref:ribonucleoside-triphosphate reductase (thioredoxin) n=1 Tax=Mycobacterium phage Gaia TaxID=1486472 RepID=A0A068F3I8_9CAUD|nr:ribonucleotide reductase [Mycobacterium phage Gaia]AID58908.1 ribonucleotide reductase [Mycobacterium phage Gaia]AYR00026.1 ribonucleotide reductase [Mycobacterium phage Nebkiss]
MLSFRLSDNFLEPYKTLEPDWGWSDAAGNSIGELTFVRTYSRAKEDGSKERWWEVCERVINGMYSLLKDHCLAHRLEWNGNKARSSAQEAYDRMFHFKWTPPGRGLFQMGTPLVMEQKNAASLQNCAMVSTGDMERHDPGYPFAWTTEALMLGIGVGFDTLGAGKFDVLQPSDTVDAYEIPDTREGWAISVGKLINSYLKPGKGRVEFDYSLIRPHGAPIKTFGGTASGPEPLREGHERIRKVLDENAGSPLSAKTIVDIQNIIGTFVVAGNTRRSAELALGLPTDEGFVDLKNSEVYPERPWAFMSNNSISASVGMDYSPFVANTAMNGEPGYVWLDTARKFGRLIDPPDYKDARVAGFNPCVEQPLESYENCCLVEAHLNRAESKEDFLRTLKFAYLYGKAVTLLTTPWEKTNAVMLRNRRIGLSTTGVAGFVEEHSLAEYRAWADEGYKRVSHWDTTYSEWLGIRESIRKTTVKPSGSVSLLSGASPGVHWPPGGEFFVRAIRFGAHDNTWRLLEKAGYKVEDDVYSPNTKVVFFPLRSSVKRAEGDVSIFEKIHLAAEAQKYWSDNGVSVTVSFNPDTESDAVGQVLSMYEGQLKAVSFLPMGNEVYEQQPYTRITEAEYEALSAGLRRVDLAELYNSPEDAVGEVYCTTDSCTIQ